MKNILSILLFTLFTLSGFAQGYTNLSNQNAAVTKSFVAGANAVPATSAVLEGRSTSKGFLMPRLTTLQRNAIGSPATGLQVYNTTTNQLNYYNGTAWITVDTATAVSNWSLTGNAGTTAGTNFIGTTDNIDLSIKVNGIERSRQYTNGNFYQYNAGTGHYIANTNNLLGYGIPVAGSWGKTTNLAGDTLVLWSGISDIGGVTATLHMVNTNGFAEAEASVNDFGALGPGVLLKSKGNTGEDMVGITILDQVKVFSPDTSAVSAFQVLGWRAAADDSVVNFTVYRNGLVGIGTDTPTATLHVVGTSILDTGLIGMPQLPSYADNAAAFAVLGAGKLYYTDESGEYVIKVTHTP